MMIQGENVHLDTTVSEGAHDGGQRCIRRNHTEIAHHLSPVAYSPIQKTPLGLTTLPVSSKSHLNKLLAGA